MRVLYVNHTGSVSGAERSLLTLIESLDAAVKPLLAAPAGPIHELATDLRVRSVTLPASGFGAGVRELHSYASATIRSTVGVHRAVSTFQPDIVHANSTRAALLCAPSTVGRAVPLVTHVRDAAMSRPFRAIARPLVALTSQRMIFVSEYASQCFGLRWSRPRVIVWNPVRPKEHLVCPLDGRARMGLRSTDIAVAVVGQLTPWKGQDVAIQAVGRLAVRFPDRTVRLLIAGESKAQDAGTRERDRRYRRQLDELAATLPQNAQVHFLGEVHDPIGLFALTDIALVPSFGEPFGRVVAEAMYAGAAPIGTSPGGPAELIDPLATGWVTSAGDVQGVADAMHQALLTDNAAGMSRAAFEFASRAFDPSTHARQVEQTYMSLLRV